MTNPTPHGQVPEALIDLIDAYAETRHRCGGIYNARTEAARNAVIEALSGVQALSAAPAGWKLVPVEPDISMQIAAKKADMDHSPLPDWLVSDWPEFLRIWHEMLAASPTPPAEQPPRWVERWHGSGGKEFWEGWSILNAANREMIAHLGPDVDPDAVRDIVAAHNEALCGECAGTGGRWCPACAGATPSAEQQAAPKAAPGEPDPADIIAGALQISRGHAIEMMREALEAAPQQEAQEPVWDGKLSDAMQNALDALYLECGPGITRDITHQVQKECEAIYTSYTTTKRMYQAARDRLELLEAAQPQPDPFAAPQQEAPVDDEFRPCPSCFGKGVEGDADDYGRTIDVSCGDCNGSGRAQVEAATEPDSAPSRYREACTQGGRCLGGCFITEPCYLTVREMARAALAAQGGE